MSEDIKNKITVCAQRFEELCTREIKKSQSESLLFAMNAPTGNFKLGVDMDMSSCPICGAPDSNGFCACLNITVIAKSEDMIDLKNAADPKKRIKEAPGKHEGKLPSDEPIKEVDTGDGNGGKVKKSSIPGLKKADSVPLKKDFALQDKVSRAQSILNNPNIQAGTTSGDHARGVAQAWLKRFAPQAGQVHAPAAGAPPTVAGPKVSSIPGLGKKEMALEKGMMPGTMKGDMAQAAYNAGTKPTTPVKPQMPSMADNAARAQMLSDFMPPGKFDVPKPNAMGTPRTIPGAKMVGPAPTPPKLPGTDIKQPPKVKQNVGGDVVSANPAPAAPGLGSMKLMRSEDLNQFEEFKKSEAFDFGTCALCGQNEHIGNCK